MAKGKGSLFSLNSQGRIGDLVFKKGHVVSERPLRLSEGRAARSPGQLAAQARYLAACQYWHTLTGAELAYWQDRAGTLSTNGGFSEFVSAFLKGELDMKIGQGVALNMYDWASWSPIGAWALDGLGGGGYYHLNNDTDPKVGDNLTIPVTLSPGTWQMYLALRLSNSRGIWSIALDGSLIEEHDEYSGSTLYCVDLVGSPFVVADYLPHTLTLECIGKNPSSTDYIANWLEIFFIRTA
jgi:hypothetical protein